MNMCSFGAAVTLVGIWSERRRFDSQSHDWSALKQGIEALTALRAQW